MKRVRRHERGEHSSNKGGCGRVAMTLSQYVEERPSDNKLVGPRMSFWALTGPDSGGKAGETIIRADRATGYQLISF